MHLKGVKLRGFKSFPDPVEVRLEPGVTVVVGPNGSGKSNIADAIVWAAGSLAPSELRAEKADDVLFAGAGGRPAAEWCEVELVFENADGRLAGLGFSEVSIARRLHRGGEGQYLVNGATVRRTDIVELLADVGLGSGMHSIIGQGRVEAVLASKPAERRELVEEAAGLGRFKQRRHRAELKLVRVAADVDRARDLETEVRKRLRPLALQATAAERAEKLAREVAGIRARLAELDLARAEDEAAAAEDRRAAAALERKRAEAALESVLADRDAAEEELADAAGRREQATAALYRLRSAGERVEMRRESAAELRDRLRTEEEELGEPGDGAAARERADEAAAVAAAAARACEATREEARLARERLSALERSLAEREGLPPAARALAEQGERLLLSLVTVEPGRERATAAALGPRASALVAADSRAAYELLERARDAGLGSLTVVADADPVELVGAFRVVPKEELLASPVPAVTREGYGYDPGRQELWFAGETAEALLLELEARRRALDQEAAELEERARSSEAAAEVAERLAQAAAAEVAALPASRAASPALRRLLPALLPLADRLEAALAAAAARAERIEPALRARVDAGGLRAGSLAERLRGLAAREADLRRAASATAERSAGIDVEIARLQAEASDARRRLHDAGADPVEDDDPDALTERLGRFERRLKALGQVNPFARDEYEQEKERLAELAVQREDLERSLAELEQLRADLTGEVERRFSETYAAVERNFRDVAAMLFPGGEGRLRLAEPEDGGEPGIEVELRPAGKRITRLSLLSGGEKALGAISFLFAVFLARPCAFYLLDEVEAALDDPNIGRFVELLRRYADRAQFIVVTHQKRTMEAADVLYGVTMGADGVSQVVSRRMAADAVPLAASA